MRRLRGSGPRARGSRWGSSSGPGSRRGRVRAGAGSSAAGVVPGTREMQFRSAGRESGTSRRRRPCPLAWTALCGHRPRPLHPMQRFHPLRLCSQALQPRPRPQPLELRPPTSCATCLRGARRLLQLRLRPAMARKALSCVRRCRPSGVQAWSPLVHKQTEIQGRQESGITDVCHCIQSYMNPRDLNSGPHACAAGFHPLSHLSSSIS
ncbi:uncharacterized protein LOC118578015 [Onychomys torridus]|uniref:uncharacterized protein LOC118578015 n=1 Tax=Onychomys torridus TaxID=38674 RepID=UPI00167F8145|nr:uncharacterized protein LOC118578015 [Onychomys torridus]